MKKRYEMQVFLDGIRQAKAYYADSVNEFAETVEFFTRYLLPTKSERRATDVTIGQKSRVK